MKRKVSAVIIIAFLLSFLGGLNVSAAGANPSFNVDFEIDLPQTGWYIYNQAGEDYANNNCVSKINTDKSYVTQGNKSLYIYDNTSSYTGIVTPYYDVKEYGEYTLSADVRTLSGEIRVYLRCYEADKVAYVQRYVGIKKNAEFETCSFSYVITPDTPYIRFLFLTPNGEGEDEGYIDNLKLIKTGDYDEECYDFSKTLQAKLDNSVPGEVVTIPDGEYSNLLLNIKTSGQSGKPITLKAENPGKVILKNASGISVSGDYVRIEGLRFEEVVSASIIHFTTESSNSGIYDCAFYNCDPPGEDSERQNWVMLRGQSLTVSGCFFSGKSSYAQMVENSKHETNEGQPDNHLIENCYFGDIKAQSANGYEAIRLGSSTFCFADSKITVQGCFFYKCNGEGETISVKSCENTVRNNTFYNNNGAIVLRHGDRNDIYGNLFIGGETNKRSATGIRINGEGHRVHDNYFYNLSNKSAALHIYHGCPYETVESHHYYKVKDLKAYNNTFIGSDRVMVVGEYSPNSNVASNRILGPEGEIYNNAIVSYSGTRPLITNGDPAPGKTNDENAYHKVKFTNNYAYGKDLGYTENGEYVTPNGVNNEYFRLVQDGKYFKPENGTGADLEIVKKAPTSPFDIISDWVKEAYYDTGRVTFEVVENDPFNNPTAHINNIIPFDISANSKSEGGTLRLFVNDILVQSNKKSVSYNPTIKVVAEPSGNKKVLWFVNGKSLEETDFYKNHITIDDIHSKELIINNITENFVIEAEFTDLYMPGDINGDGVVNTKDITVLRRYNSGGYDDLKVIKELIDVNKDGIVNTKDITILRRYNSGGYDIELN